MKREDLGPLLKGDRPTKTLYDIKFRGGATPNRHRPASLVRYTLLCASCSSEPWRPHQTEQDGRQHGAP
eukprot:2209030-Pleurochrysis_carterae.AAC.1